MKIYGLPSPSLPRREYLDTAPLLDLLMGNGESTYHGGCLSC